jgi:phage terminase large subunit
VPAELRVQIPEKFEFLYWPLRYKIAWGGRGSAKSTTFADALITKGLSEPLRILCARETQTSIKDSVHQLLDDRIRLRGLTDLYNVGQAEITGPNGTSFIFAGLRQNIGNIKSFEGIDIVWVEEAQSVSKESWDVLIPTIRKAGSEIWVSFNPELETDATYQRFVINPPPSAHVVHVTFRDNPWFYLTALVEEMEHSKRTDPDGYHNVWEGYCRRSIEGAIYASELRAAEIENRITQVPYNPIKTVNTCWDIGYGDTNAIWCVQTIGYQYHLIDYYENRQKNLDHYLKWLQQRDYVYGQHYLPHDAAAPELGSGKSIEEQMREKGFEPRVVKRLRVQDAISAARTMFNVCWFDAEKCSDGLKALRHYRYGKVETGQQEKREPLHDWSSHGADAFRTFAVGIQPDEPEEPEYRRRPYSSVGSAHGWMR